jgi:uncharacterized SAM-binding protein YcdF (DUF218 family)
VILLLVAIGLAKFSYRKTSLSCLMVVTVLLLLSGSGLLPQLLLKNLQAYPVASSDQHWGKYNAVVLLGAGAVEVPSSNKAQPLILAYSRIYQAAYFYQACKKSGNRCMLIISGGDASNIGVPEAVIYQDNLVNLGIKQADIILEPHSMNTYQNAEFTSTILKSQGFDKIFLVTSGIQLKRALLYFTQFGVKWSGISLNSSVTLPCKRKLRGTSPANIVLYR